MSLDSSGKAALSDAAGALIGVLLPTLFVRLSKLYNLYDLLWLRVRYVAAPVHVQMTALRELNVPLEVLTRRATWAVDPLTAMSIHVPVLWPSGERLRREPVLRRLECDTLCG